MSATLSKLKDNKRRFVFKDREHKFMVLDWVLNVVNSKRVEMHLDKSVRFKINKFIYKQRTYSTKPNQSITRIRNQCLKCAKQRSSSRFFRLTRLSLLEELKKTHKFPGVTRKLNSK